jgi:hypothetical protein
MNCMFDNVVLDMYCTWTIMFDTVVLDMYCSYV